MRTTEEILGKKRIEKLESEIKLHWGKDTPPEKIKEIRNRIIKLTEGYEIEGSGRNLISGGYCNNLRRRLE